MYILQKNIQQNPSRKSSRLSQHSPADKPRTTCQRSLCGQWRRDVRAGADPGFFFRRGCTRFLLYFNTNKPHSFFFWQNTSFIRKPQVISGGGSAHPMHPPPRSAPEGPFIYHVKRKRNIFGIFLKTTGSPSSKYEHRRTSPFNA